MRGEPQSIVLVNPHSGAATPHVLVPLEVYERMRDEFELLELKDMMNAPESEWLDDEQSRLYLVGKDLVEARKRAGLTQAQLARRLRMPQSQISRIERNPERTTVRTMKRIAAALGVDVGTLLKS
jgi:ribosome-binding protein aMBF1 (putative translation factor)